MNRSSVLQRTALVCVTALLVAAAAACSDDDDASSGSKSPEKACADVCAETKFSSSRVDVQPNETNCFCTGAGTMTTDACTNMCSSLGKSKAQAFGSAAGPANACQCS